MKPGFAASILVVVLGVAADLSAQSVSPSYETWATTQFGADAADPGIAAKDADPDGDGLLNLIEYALVRLPERSDSAGAVDISVWVDPSTGLSYPAVGFDRRRFAPDGRSNPKCLSISSSGGTVL